VSATTSRIILRDRPLNPQWPGDYVFLLQNLILKDFRIRYRNMSLGVFWSLLNPLVMMGVLWFVFTKIFENPMRNFPVFVLCGLVPYNFFSAGWVLSTTSIVENATLIKRVPVPREVIPIASVFSNCIHLAIQIVLLLVLVVVSGYGVNRYWLWLPFVWTCEVVFLCGLGLIFSALNVYIRDIRYVVESANVVLFWLVPIFYDFSTIPHKYAPVYHFNPVAALVLASRNILLKGIPPPDTLLVNLVSISVLMLIIGLLMFRVLKRRFYDFL
jgi:ABC-type polysaccharide/polyol phosphate export permease